MAKTLAELRAEIDQLDQQMLDLISARARCAVAVGTYKKDHPEKNTQFYRPEREAEVLRNIAALNSGPLADEEVSRLFREIMSACLALEQPMNIAFLGPAGTFTEEAALKHFGHSVKTTAMQSIDEVFREVESGSCHYGVVPVENSTEGVITHTLDNFSRSVLKIVGEVELRIHHHLLAQVDSMDQIETVYSHQQSLAQCRQWLDANMSTVQREAVASNAYAANKVKDMAKAAAIASSSAAQKYDLNILASNIEDQPDNTTRFLVIGHNEVSATGEDKTSLLVSAPNQSGALHQLLAPFAKHNVSLTRIESRPSRSAKWEYVFFLDLEAHIDDMPLSNALDELRQVSDMVKILGSYPKGAL